jgi:hypothetical protein
VLGLRADPLSIHIEAGRSLFAKHLMDWSQKDAINAAGELLASTANPHFKIELNHSQMWCVFANVSPSVLIIVNRISQPGSVLLRPGLLSAWKRENSK